MVTLNCEVEDAGEVLGVLRARLRGFRVKPFKRGSSALPTSMRWPSAAAAPIWRGGLGAAAARLSACRADRRPDLGADEGSEPDARALPAFRSAAMKAPITAGAVCTWQSGFPLRVSYASGAPRFDPYRYPISRMLTDGEGDLLVWIASFSPDFAPPSTDMPTVVLGTPGLKLPSRHPAVFIPVGTPGVDHAGRLIRCDNVVSLPLKDFHPLELPQCAEILAAIEAAL